MSTNWGEKELLLYANYYYHRMGFNVTGISNVKNKYNEFDTNLSKTPNHPWLYLTKNRQDIDIFNSYNWQSAVGMGTVLGYRNLRAIDVDGSQSNEFITKTLKMLNLPLDYEWVVKSGSGNGFHIIFYSEDHNFLHEAGDPNPNISFGPNDSNRGIFERLELRWIGHLVLPPTSLHNYHFVNINIPKNRPKDVSSDQVTVFVQSTCRKIFEEVIGSDGGCRYVVDDIESFTDVSNSNVSIISNWITDHGLVNSNFKGYLVVDTETNGLPPNFNNHYSDGSWPRLIQLAYAIFNTDGDLLLKKNFLITPCDFDIKEDVLQLTCIDNERLINYGVPLQVVLKQFIFDTQNIEFIIGHNIEYDMKVLLAECHRLGISLFSGDKKLFCTMKNSLLLKNINSLLNGKYPKLSELHKILFNTELRGAHNAMNDVMATNKCFRELNRLTEIQKNLSISY